MSAPEQNKKSIVRIQNAHKYYNRGRNNELHVMDNINLELPESGMIAVFGQSGCGKTTLLNAIGGLDKIASGSIEVFGQNIRENTDILRNRYIGYIFQNYNLSVTDTVYENVAAALRLCGMSDENEISDRVMAALENVGMDKYSGRTPDTLSGGQQQRVAIARALVKNPAIILADEPTGNLDETNTVLVMDILKEISRTHLVLLVTHEANLVDYYCDRVIEIVDGRVNSVRENNDANGYVQRSKNDIYLGELTRTDTSTPGVTLEYYGDPTSNITLRVVHVGGKLYLQADDPTLKIVDEGSEIKFKEGVFQETPVDGKTANNPSLDMSRLPPFEGKSFGRLYRFKDAMIDAWRQNFSKKRKKGSRLLRISLIVMAISMVFIAASMGAGLQGYMDEKENHNEALFYLPLSPDKDYSVVSSSMGQHGMAYARVIGGMIDYSQENLSFAPAAFMTAAQSSLSASAYAQDIANAAGIPLVAGENKLQNAGDIVITTAMADDLIESSTASYINDYRDLVGLVTNNAYYSMGNRNLRIVGVVQSSEQFFYMDGMLLAEHILNSCYMRSMPFISASDPTAKEDAAGLKPGEMIYRDFIYEGSGEMPIHSVGDTVILFGKTFTIAKVIMGTIPTDGMIDGDIIYGKPGTDMQADFEDIYVEDVYIENIDASTTYIVTDEDYKALSSAVGKMDERFGTDYYYYESYGDDDYWCNNHLMIRSTDPAATAAYLNGALGDEFVVTPDEILAGRLSNIRVTTVVGVVSILVLLAFMCLCVFFVMRSSFMSRVREVGILRAIGVSKRNLIFRFFMETVLLILLTLGIGYGCTSWFIGSLSKAVLFSSLFYYPLWLALGIFVVIVATSLFFGVLPAMLLLRKTPSEILSKYDI